MAQRIFWLLITFSLTWLMAGLTAPAAWAADHDQSTVHARSASRSAHATRHHTSSHPKHHKSAAHSRRHAQYRRASQRLERFAQQTDTSLWFCSDGFDQGEGNDVLASSSCPVTETVRQWMNTIMGEQLTAQLALVEATEDFLEANFLLQWGQHPTTPLLATYFTSLGHKDQLGVGEFSQVSNIWLQERSWIFASALHDTTADWKDAPGDTSPFGYRYALNQQSSVHAGAEWMSAIGDTTGMMQDFADAGYDMQSSVSGVNLTLGYSFHDFTVTGGYIRAVEGPNNTTTFGNEQSGDPTAWNSELAYSTKFLDKTTIFSVGYMRSSDALASYLPEERYSTKASIFLQERTTLSLEYYQDRPFSDTGMDNTGAYGITTRLGFRF